MQLTGHFVGNTSLCENKTVVSRNAVIVGGAPYKAGRSFGGNSVFK